jgi:short-subunit dehydrogenase
MSKRTIAGSRGLVTGASSGIGRAIAEELARSGARVLAMARREDRLATLPDGIERFAGDVSDPSARQAAIDRARQVFGGLDFLVNAAGISRVGRFDEHDPEVLRQIMEVNFFAPAEMIRVALPELRKGNRPIIVNVSSILGHRAIPLHSEYCASKFALQGLSESLRAELSKQQIDLLVVSPGTTQSELYDNDPNRQQLKWNQSAGVPAAYVARRTVRAMQAGRHEIIPSFGGKWMVRLNRICPALLDRILVRYA